MLNMTANVNVTMLENTDRRKGKGYSSSGSLLVSRPKAPGIASASAKLVESRNLFRCVIPAILL
jgi:hypothetical protein